MVNIELHCVQLFNWYIRLVTTVMLDTLPCAIVYCHAVHCVLGIVKWCSEAFDHSVRMLPITAVLGSHQSRLRIWLGAQGGSLIRSRREDFAGGSAVLPTLREGMEIELPGFEAQNATLKGDSLRQLVEIVIGGVPNVLEVRCMCWFMYLPGIQVRGSVSTNLFDLMRHYVDLWKVVVGIKLLGNIKLVADIIPPGIQFVRPFGQCPSFSICFLVYLSLLHEYQSQGIGFGLHDFAD